MGGGVGAAAAGDTARAVAAAATATEVRRRRRMCITGEVRRGTDRYLTISGVNVVTEWQLGRART